MAKQFTRRRRTRTRWDANTSGFTFAGLSAGTSALTLVSAGIREETLLRARGQLLAYLDGIQAPGTGILVGIGLIVMPQGTSTTVTSSPISDPDAPWLYISRFFLGYEEYVTDVIDAVGAPVYRETVDNKAMRIIRSDREIQLVVENVTTFGAASVNIAFDARLLFQQN